MFKDVEGVSEMLGFEYFSRCRYQHYLI